MTDLLVAVADAGQVRGYYRGADGSLSQVAQFVTRGEIDPARLAAVVADLGDTFGWAGGLAPVEPARAVPAARAKLPAARRAAPAIEKPKRRRVTAEQAAAEHAAILAYIGEHPQCPRRHVAEHLWGPLRVGEASAANARLCYRMRAIMDRIVITPGVGIEPDLLRLRVS